MNLSLALFLSFFLFLCVSIDYIYYMQQLRAKMIDFGASLHSYLLILEFVASRGRYI